MLTNSVPSATKPTGTKKLATSGRCHSVRLVCANRDCPTRGFPQRACYIAPVVIAERHGAGKQKRININICFDCYYTNLRTPEKKHPHADYQEPRRKSNGDAGA